MKLSKKDRLILVNQFKILSSIDGYRHYDEYVSILEDGYSLLYDEIFETLNDDLSPADCEFVFEILNFYRAIEKLAQHSDNRKNLEKEQFYFFKGFDGNNEGHFMMFARFLINEQGRYSEQEKYLSKNDNLNSHTQMIPIYKSILNKAKKIKIWEMSLEQAIDILRV